MKIADNSTNNHPGGVLTVNPGAVRSGSCSSGGLRPAKNVIIPIMSISLVLESCSQTTIFDFGSARL